MAIVGVVLLILASAVLAFAWASAAVSIGFRHSVTRVTLLLMTMAWLTALVGMLLGRVLGVEGSAEEALRWIVIVALAVELAPFIISDIVNRKADREGG